MGYFKLTFQVSECHQRTFNEMMEKLLSKCVHVVSKFGGLGGSYWMDTCVW